MKLGVKSVSEENKTIIMTCKNTNIIKTIAIYLLRFFQSPSGIGDSGKRTSFFTSFCNSTGSSVWLVLAPDMYLYSRGYFFPMICQKVPNIAIRINPKYEYGAGNTLRAIRNI